MRRNSSVRGWVLVLAVLLGGLDGVQAQPMATDEDVYVVQPGDTCASVGRKVFGDANTGSAKLHALNQMGPPPHVLKPGSRLRVKGDPDARLTFVKPEVNSKRAGKADWLEASAGQGLWRLDSVNTLRQAGAEMTFRDLTRLQMNENALVVIYGQGSGANDKVKKSGAVELLQGELSVSLAELRGEPVGVTMPAGSVASRAKDMVVGVDAQQMTRVSVYDGQAEVSSQGQRVQVPRNHGTRVAKGERPEAPRPLPDAPAWTGGDHSVRLVLAGEGVEEILPWEPVANAASYRVEVASDERFNDKLYAETLVPSGPGGLKSQPVSLSPGQYFARVRAVDAAGLLGVVSLPRRIEVRRVKAERGSLGPKGLTGPWPLAFSVEGAEDLEARLDGAPVALPLRVEAVGAHTLELRPRGMPDARPELLTLTVAPPQATLALEPVGEGESFFARVRVFDETKTPVEPPPGVLTLRGLEGTQVLETPSRQGDGSFVARAVPVERDGQREAAVEALWSGTSLGRLEARRPVPVVAPPPSGPEVSLSSLVGAPVGGRRDATALPTVFLPRALLVELRGQSGTAAPGVDVAGTRTALSVEGRLDAPAALGAAVSMRPGGDSRELAASLSGRVLLREESSFRVQLSLEGLYSGAEFVGETRGVWLRPALMVGGLVGEHWAWSSSQGYAIRAGSSRATWDSTYQGWFLPTPSLALGAELNALVDATLNAPGPDAYAAGVGARWKHGDFELGAAVRRGFGPEAASLWGGWGAQVTLGWSGLLPTKPQ